MLLKRAMRERKVLTAPRAVQYAALPYRKSGKSGLEIMLVTSRGTGRWIIPKGWPKGGKSPNKSAADEAFEEAGVIGKIGQSPIGTYSYDKTMEGDDPVPCSVHVFALEVTREHENWPEKSERQVQWYTPEQAARIVDESELRRLIRSFAKHK